MKGLDLKIAEDGEILLKGPMMFKGYWKLEEETKNAFNSDGYFMSGDIGRFDEKGFLFITDRKKDLIITSGGKNIAPQKIETLLKENPLFAQAVVVGERKNYLCALLNLDYDIAAQIAKTNGITVSNSRDLAKNAAFLKIIDNFIAGINAKLAQYETVKKFKILEKDFTQEGGELTVSLKVKRNVVHAKYSAIIDEMYAGDK